MIEKILKLMKSESYGDIYIGLTLFDKLSYKERMRFLRANATKNVYDCTWFLHFSTKVVVPEEDVYIIGKHYYSIQPLGVIFDSPARAKKWTNPNPDNRIFKIKETWT